MRVRLPLQSPLCCQTLPPPHPSAPQSEEQSVDIGSFPRVSSTGLEVCRQSQGKQLGSWIRHLDLYFGWSRNENSTLYPFCCTNPLCPSITTTVTTNHTHPIPLGFYTPLFSFNFGLTDEDILSCPKVPKLRQIYQNINISIQHRQLLVKKKKNTGCIISRTLAFIVVLQSLKGILCPVSTLLERLWSQETNETSQIDWNEQGACPEIWHTFDRPTPPYPPGNAMPHSKHLSPWTCCLAKRLQKQPDTGRQRKRDWRCSPFNKLMFLVPRALYLRVCVCVLCMCGWRSAGTAARRNRCALYCGGVCGRTGTRCSLCLPSI